MYDRCHLADGCGGDEACAALCPDIRRPPRGLLRLQLTDADTVLVCQLVATAERIVRGSVQRACAECGRQIWKAPGPALLEVQRDGRLTPAGPIAPDPTVLLCTTCGDMHLRAITGRGLGL